MIDLNRIPNDIAGFFYGEGYSIEELEKGFKIVPDWVPSEYWEFWENHTAVTIYSTMFLNCQPYGHFSNALEGFVEKFNNYGFDLPGEVFPVAYSGGFEWGIFHKESNGEIVCGEYDFQAGEFFRGPFHNFDDWIYSYRDMSDE